MEREILFRGKRLDNGKWVYGMPFFGTKESCKMICACAVHPEFEDEENVYYCDGYPVDPATVGQYIGLTDKNGVKIFAGDIVHYVYETSNGFWNADQLSIIVWGHTGFKLDGIMGTNKYALMQGWLVSIPCPEGALEVIGNIHDNSDFLEEAQQ